MANIDPLLRRNQDFATGGAYEGVSIVAKHPVYVITCLDPRTDPSAFLELEPGDHHPRRAHAPPHVQPHPKSAGASSL
jgi:carbonic anhydrase